VTQPLSPDARRVGNGPRTLDDGARVIDLADPDWCWSQLAGSTRGALCPCGPGRPATLDVEYTLHDEEIFIPIASDHELLHLLADREVTLGLVGFDDDGLKWVVRVTGIAGLSLPFSAADLFGSSRRSHPAHRGSASPDVDAMLVLPSERIRGYHEARLHPTA
jgi:hypothetical protein